MDDLTRKIICCIRRADDGFEADGIGGTKEWYDNFFSVELEKEGLVITTVESNT